MNAADVIVLPFEEVLTSGSALLAMSFRKALIAPRMGCAGELLDSNDGFAYEPKDENGLLRAMEQALTADLEAMGRTTIEKQSSSTGRRSRNRRKKYTKIDVIVNGVLLFSTLSISERGSNGMFEFVLS